MRQRLPKVFYNPISLTGAVIAVFNAAFAVFLVIAEVFAKHHRPYADLVIFLIMPALVLFGIVLIIIGALFGRMAQVLWVIAILGNLTVIHRMIYTFQEAKRLEDAQLRAPGAREPGKNPSTESATLH